MINDDIGVFIRIIFIFDKKKFRVSVNKQIFYLEKKIYTRTVFVVVQINSGHLLNKPTNKLIVGHKTSELHAWINADPFADH